jgi:2-oxo-4-hydroxy-4-carboxy-5-ureidoimidazoline decarboxylase
VQDVAADRPYATAPEVLHRARASAASFTDAEIDGALARHPRIGEQAGAGHDADFSQREQAAVGDADPEVTAAIRAGNAEYENRFDRVFVIRAAGRPATEILAELRRRLNNTPEAERAEVVTQLREIALTRLETILA